MYDSYDIIYNWFNFWLHMIITINLHDYCCLLKHNMITELKFKFFTHITAVQVCFSLSIAFEKIFCGITICELCKYCNHLKYYKCVTQNRY